MHVESTGGIIIKEQSVSVFCYADDPMLSSITVAGLQTMIHVANRYVTEHGMQFNQKKPLTV